MRKPIRLFDRTEITLRIPRFQPVELASQTFPMTDLSSSPLVQTHGLTVTKSNTQILQKISLTINPAEIVTVIGPNGAGKSTLIKTILRLVKPSSGRIDYHPDLSIGYMPQKFHLDPTLPLTVKRFLQLATKNQERAKQLLEEVGAAQVYERMVGQLSGGELQRVLLARALMAEPNLLILDEPAQGVDLTGQNQLYQLIGELRDRHHMAVLMVSHDLHFVMAATDHVICLNQHICCSGHPEAVSNDPAYHALFAGGAMDNQLAIYNHHHDHHHELDGHVESDHSGCDHD